MPPDTIEAFRNHDGAHPSLTQNVEAAIRVTGRVRQAGMPFHKLIDTVRARRATPPCSSTVAPAVCFMEFENQPLPRDRAPAHDRRLEAGNSSAGVNTP